MELPRHVRSQMEFGNERQTGGNVILFYRMKRVMNVSSRWLIWVKIVQVIVGEENIFLG